MLYFLKNMFNIIAQLQTALFHIACSTICTQEIPWKWRWWKKGAWLSTGRCRCKLHTSRNRRAPEGLSGRRRKRSHKNQPDFLATVHRIRVHSSKQLEWNWHSIQPFGKCIASQLFFIFCFQRAFLLGEALLIQNNLSWVAGHKTALWRQCSPHGTETRKWLGLEQPHWEHLPALCHPWPPSRDVCWLLKELARWSSQACTRFNTRKSNWIRN